MGCMLLLLILQPASAQTQRNSLENAFSKYRVSATACARIEHYSGSVIYIPENAFDLMEHYVDSVDIYYRELRSPIDMVIHKIPMTYNVLGRQVHLESSGMFEIYARVGADNIGISEDRSIEVRFAIPPEQRQSQTEGYRLDTGQNQWTSYSSNIGLNGIDENDDDLWGSSPVQNEVMMEDEDGVLFTTADSIRQVVFQSMEIFDFGLYNYDRIIRGETYIPIMASFVDDQGKAFESSVFVVYEGLNSVFEYWPGDWAEKFSILDKRSYKLFTIDEEGKVYTLSEFPSLSDVNGKNHTFRLKARGDAPKDKPSLIALTGVE